MDKSPSSPRPFSAPRYALTLLAVLLAWTGLYVSIQPLATWLTFDLLSLTPGGPRAWLWNSSSMTAPRSCFCWC